MTAADGSDPRSATSARSPRCRSAGTRRSRPAVAWGERFGARPAAARHARRACRGRRRGDGRSRDAHSVAPSSAALADADRRRGCSPRWAGRPPTSTRRSRRASPTPARTTPCSPPPRRGGSPGSTTTSTALGALMAARDWTTIQLVHREGPDRFHARNPFPPGGVVEDPATGAAAAAFGGYLRELGAVAAPATVTIHQGDRARAAEPAHGRRSPRATAASASPGRPCRSGLTSTAAGWGGGDARVGVGSAQYAAPSETTVRKPRRRLTVSAQSSPRTRTGRKRSRDRRPDDAPLLPTQPPLTFAVTAAPRRRRAAPAARVPRAAESPPPHSAAARRPSARRSPGTSRRARRPRA